MTAKKKSLRAGFVMGLRWLIATGVFTEAERADAVRLLNKIESKA